MRDPPNLEVDLKDRSGYVLNPTLEEASTMAAKKNAKKSVKKSAKKNAKKSLKATKPRAKKTAREQSPTLQ
jgi:prophage tail gpP-like protein